MDSSPSGLDGIGLSSFVCGGNDALSSLEMLSRGSAAAATGTACSSWSEGASSEGPEDTLSDSCSGSGDDCSEVANGTGGGGTNGSGLGSLGSSSGGGGEGGGDPWTSSGGSGVDSGLSSCSSICVGGGESCTSTGGGGSSIVSDSPVS